MCIFCKIVSGEIPSDKVYEDERVLAFRDIHPQAPTHILVIPKKHFESVADVTSDNSQDIAACFEVISLLIGRYGLKNGARVISNCGPGAGQTVPHVHFHLLAGRDMGEALI